MSNITAHECLLIFVSGLIGAFLAQGIEGIFADNIVTVPEVLLFIVVMSFLFVLTILCLAGYKWLAKQLNL